VVVAVVVAGVVAVAAVAVLRRGAARQHDGVDREVAIRRALDQQVGAELHRMGELVGQLQRSQAHAHGELAARLGETVRSTRELGATTRLLQEALGNSRVRGQWGERMAADVLRAAGLVEGVNFLTQQTVAGGTRPDLTLLLPDDRLLHVDVKFPVDHYLAALEAPTEHERAEHEQAFVRAVRGHLKAVAGRGYADGATTPGFAVVFIPNEAVYAFVMASDPGLVDTALAQGLVLCSPFTLFAVLAVVRQASDAFRLGQASEEILGSLARFRTQWQKFSEQLDRVERQFETAHRGFEELAGPRRRQLERQLDHVEQLDGDASARRPPPRFVVLDGEESTSASAETLVNEVGVGR